MRRDAFWSGLEALAGGVLAIVTSFVIARLIGSSELGIGAAAVAVNVVLWVGVNALFADALVQMPQINDRILSSAFWASTSVGVLASLAQAISGLVLAHTLGDARLVSMGLVLALPLPLVGSAGALQGFLTRNRAYRSLALRTLVGQGLGTAVGGVAAIGGMGAWAVVLQQTVASAVGALALLCQAGWRPAWCLEAPAVVALLRVGAPLTASTLVLIGRYRLFVILIGASAGPAVLGQVHIAFRLVDTVRELGFTALWRLMLPRLSQHRHDAPAMLAEVDRWVRRNAVLFLPLSVMMAFGLGPVVTAMMGSTWHEASRATLPLLVLMVWSAATFPAGVALVAVGRTRLALYANLASLVAACAGVWLFAPQSAPAAAMIWTVGQVAVSPLSLWMNGRALGVNPLRPLTGGLGTRQRYGHRGP